MLGFLKRGKKPSPLNYEAIVAAVPELARVQLDVLQVLEKYLETADDSTKKVLLAKIEWLRGKDITFVVDTLFYSVELIGHNLEQYDEAWRISNELSILAFQLDRYYMAHPELSNWADNTKRAREAQGNMLISQALSYPDGSKQQKNTALQALSMYFAYVHEYAVAFDRYKSVVATTVDGKLVDDAFDKSNDSLWQIIDGCRGMIKDLHITAEQIDECYVKGARIIGNTDPRPEMLRFKQEITA